MDDSFALGDPAKHPARLGRAHTPKPARVGLSPAGRVIGVVALVAAVGGGAYGFMRVLASGGEQAAEAAQTALEQVPAAQDLAAQETSRRTTFAAMAMYAQDGEYPTAEALGAADPSLTFTAAESTGPTVASVVSTPEAFAVAVASPSGACVWSRVSAEGGVTYGSGDPCTGQAALAASDPTW